MKQYNTHMIEQQQELEAWKGIGDLPAKNEADIQSLRKDLTEHQSLAADISRVQHDASETMHKDLKELITSLSNKVNTMEDDIAKQKVITKSLTESHESHVSSLNDLIADLRTEVESLKEQQTLSDKEIEDHLATISSLERTVAQLRLEMRTKTSTNSKNAKENKDMIDQLTEEIAMLRDELRNVEEWTLTSVDIFCSLSQVAIAKVKLQNPACILKIRIRTLMDVVIAILYEAVNGTPPDAKHIQAKKWWARLLDPISSREEQKNKTPAEIDDLRFDLCHQLLVSHGLDLQSPYEELIDSGTLRYITQTDVGLRSQANSAAHSELDIPELKRTLSRAKMAAEQVCTEEEYRNIDSMISFVEVMQQIDD